jgi:hypothetical protein
MASKSERQFFVRAADARHKLCPPIAEGDEVDSKSRIFEQGCETFGAKTFGARRIDRLEPDEVLRQFD